MSLNSFTWNNRIYWDVLCTFTIDGEENRYVFKAVANTLEESLEDAKKNHVWSNHPTFTTRIVGIRFE